MQTDELIRSLAAEAAPVRPGALLTRLLAALAVGVAVSFVVMVAWLGIRPDLREAMTTAPFWVKFVYPLVLAMAACGAVERLARPGGRARLQGMLILAAFAVVALLGAVQAASTPAAGQSRLWLGESFNVCPWRILVLATPILAALLWAVRGMAPTRLVLAGLASGLAAGAAGAWVYAFHCGETAMPFLTTWYTLGIVLTGAVGALLARPLLRW